MTTTRRSLLGPNHKDGCAGSDRRHSGSGYNRVLVCSCGAEDHDPELGRHPPERIAECRDQSRGIAPSSSPETFLPQEN